MLSFIDIIKINEAEKKEEWNTILDICHDIKIEDSDEILLGSSV